MPKQYQPQTADDIRRHIARNPQSEEMRAYLIRMAVEHNIADEIPDDWSVSLYNPENVEYDDTQDLIADHYELNIYQSNPLRRSYTYAHPDANVPSNLSINAHESGALSFTIRPSTEPIIKFGIPTADQLLEMFRHIEYSQNNIRDAITSPLVEPTTGIRYDPIAPTDGNLTIPNSHGADVVILFNDQDDMIEGLSAMANSAETYGQSSQEIMA